MKGVFVDKLAIYPEKKDISNLLFYEEVKIIDSTLDFLLEESKLHPGKETGGVLIGYNQNNALIITVATGPGPKAIHGSHRFLRDKDFCQAQLDHWAVNTNRTWDYIGEWHKHTTNTYIPSHTDKQSLCYIAKAKNYHVTQPIQLIVCMDSRHKSDFMSYLYYPDAPYILSIKPKIITSSELPEFEWRAKNEFYSL